MSWRRFFLEAATLILAAVLCALVANALASKERKLNVVSVPPPTRVAAGASPAGEPARAPAPTQTVAAAPVPQPATVNRQPATKKKPTPGVRRPTPEFNPHPDKPYIEIHGDDVAYLRSKGVLFLDARRTSVYEQGHIPGARPFSVWESDVDEKVNKLYAERPDPKEQNLPIVIYCSGGDCEDSHMLAQKLWGVGFNNAYVYKDGFPDWQKRGEPVHTGSNP